MVQPASVDLRLGNSFRVFHNHRVTAIDLREPPSDLTEQVIVEEDEPFVIHPGEFCLGRTEEWVELPDDIVARIEGKSSLGRLGLIVHATAGFCDPGWKGTLTLELNNLTRVPIKLWPGPADRAAVVHDARHRRAAPLRPPRARQPLPRPGRGDREPLRGRARGDLAACPGRRRVGSRPMIQALLVLAAEEAERSETPFYIAGVVFACLGDLHRRQRPALGVVPVDRHAGPRDHRRLASLLAAVCMGLAVYVSN